MIVLTKYTCVKVNFMRPILLLIFIQNPKENKTANESKTQFQTQMDNDNSMDQKNVNFRPTK